MDELILYLVKVALCLSLLFGVYRKYLSELAFFAWSRFFLLLALPVSLWMPLVELPLWPINIERTGDVAHVPDNPDQVLVFYRVPSFETSAEMSLILWIIGGMYLLGVLIFSVNLLRKILRTAGEYRSAAETQAGHFLSDDEVPAWSFLGRVIINGQVNALPEAEKNQVLAHEFTHAKQGHSFDILLYEWASVLLWFNPLVPRIRRELTMLHEYLADREVVKHNNAQAYSRLILKLARTPLSELSSGFGNQQVAKRIFMLNKHEASPLRKLRFLLVVPLIGVLLGLFSLVDHAVFGKVNPQGLSTGVWEFPFTNQFAIIQTYSQEEQIDKGNISYTLGHERVTFVAKARQDVVAIADGEITNTWTTDNWGVPEYGFALATLNEHILVVEGLAKLNVTTGQVVEKGEALGETGNNDLYPKIEMEMWRDKKRIDLLSLYK